jgi:putative ABC transport system ATP-binding protein
MSMDLTPETAAIYCQGAKKTFREDGNAVVALRGIDLVARPGELLMLVGPSGSGKTTLLSVIAAILDADEGDVRVFGTRVHDLSDHEKTAFRAANLGFIFQQFHLLPTLTAAENVAVPLLIQGARLDDAVARARKMLAQVELGDRAASLPRQLSGGQQQRVAIARALVSEPRLVVCDEPTSALDARTGGRILELLREAAVRPGRCVLVVTHDARIFRFADRIAHMDDGRIVSLEEGGAHAA